MGRPSGREVWSVFPCLPSHSNRPHNQGKISFEVGNNFDGAVVVEGAALEVREGQLRLLTFGFCSSREGDCELAQMEGIPRK